MKSRLAAAAAAVIATATLAGCNFITPQATLTQYDPADGVSGASGAVEIRNALLVVDGDLSSLVVTFDNAGPATTLDVTVGDETQRVALDSGLTPYGFPDRQLVFSADVTIGALEAVVFAADAADRASLSVPTFSTDTANWSDYGPVAPDASPSPSDGTAPSDGTEPSSTPEPSSSPEPSETTAP